MTVTIIRGWIVILLLDVAVQQHDEYLFSRFIYGIYGVHRMRFR